MWRIGIVSAIAFTFLFAGSYSPAATAIFDGSPSISAASASPSTMLVAKRKKKKKKKGTAVAAVASMRTVG
jgi:hypothetical protein